jgi:hypothetical protein
MPRGSRGDAGVRRVVEQFFALTTDDADDVEAAGTSGEPDLEQIPDAADSVGRSARRGPTTPGSPSA